MSKLNSTSGWSEVAEGDTINYRNELLLFLLQDCEMRYKEFEKLEHHQLSEYFDSLPDDMVEFIRNNKDILKSWKTGKNLSVRGLQEVKSKYTRKLLRTDRYIKHNIIIGNTDKEYFCGYTPMQGLSLDEEFELRLEEPDLVTFLRGCGYNNKELSMKEIRGGLNGFNSKLPAHFYVHKVYCTKLNLEFIKYGVTNIDVSDRIRVQLYNSNRFNKENKTLKYKLESTLLFSSDKLCGQIVWDIEKDFKERLNNCDKVPSTIFNDGHTETVTIDNYDILESLLEQHFNISVDLYS